MGNNTAILSRAHQLGSLAFNELMDIKQDLKEKQKKLYEAFSVSSYEEIQDTEAHRTGAELEDLIHAITFRADSLSEWLDKLEEIEIEGF